MQTSSFQYRFKDKLGKVHKGGELKIQEQNAVIKIEQPIYKYHILSPQPKSLPPYKILFEQTKLDSLKTISKLKFVRNPSLPEIPKIQKKSPKKKVKLAPLYTKNDIISQQSVENYRNITHRCSVNTIQHGDQFFLKKNSLKNQKYQSYYQLSRLNKLKNSIN